MNRMIDYAIYTAFSGVAIAVICSPTLQEALFDMERPKSYKKPLYGYFGFLPPQDSKDYAYLKLAFPTVEGDKILGNMEFTKPYREREIQKIIEHNKTASY